VGQFVGNVRVSIRDPNLDAQLDVLRAAGCVRIFAATASGALRERPEPAAARALLASRQTTTAATRAISVGPAAVSRHLTTTVV
jgi:hypothetical protein